MAIGDKNWLHVFLALSTTPTTLSCTVRLK